MSAKRVKIAPILSIKSKRMTLVFEKEKIMLYQILLGLIYFDTFCSDPFGFHTKR